MDHVAFINILATITTLLQFSFQLVDVLKIIKEKSTKNIANVSSCCGILSCTLWFFYGVLVKDLSIELVNAFGSFCFIFYTYIYYVYSLKKRSVIKQVTICKIIIVSILIYMFNEKNIDSVSRNIGVIASSFTVLLFGSPMLLIYRVIQSKNTDCLPYSFIVLSFLVSLQWLIYGILIDDIFVKVPNFIGAIISVIQLSLFIIFPSTSKSIDNSKNLVIL